MPKLTQAYAVGTLELEALFQDSLLISRLLLS
jgi:hypothetical protein